MVAMKIRDMKDNKSPGVDGIPPRLLLEIVEQISIPLATVFNLSLEEGIVPLEWKEANIIPLFKKGSRNKSENYRPVSLTSVICKLLERLIKDHLVDFLVKNKLINPSQHGFLKARSCLTNMLCQSCSLVCHTWSVNTLLSGNENSDERSVWRCPFNTDHRPGLDKNSLTTVLFLGKKCKHIFILCLP